MRYTAAEKREIIQLVEQSSLPVKQTLQRLDITKSTFYNWLHRYHWGGEDRLIDKRPEPGKVWNKVPSNHHESLLKLALDRPELSPR